MFDSSHQPIVLRDGIAAAEIDNPSEAGCFKFRDYLIVPGHRTLMRNGEAVEIGSRAFDLLHVLVRAQGRVVQKREIFAFVWPAMTVDESNLRFQIACLRRALGEDRDVVKTVQGRGYMFASGPEFAQFPAHREHLPSTDGVDLSRSVSAGPARVAVIEDDESTLEALSGLLRSSGLAPLCFSSSEEFLVSGVGRSAHCLVLDVCLPGRSGLDFHAGLKGAGVDMPVIFISGHADVPMSVRAMKAGAVEFLTKPVRHEELLQAVNNAVVRRAA